MAEVESIRDFHRLREVEWMDSMTDPNNALLNRLWKHRRGFQSLLVGAGTWGEFWVSMLPLLRWAKGRWWRSPQPSAAGEKLPQAEAV
jgi:hypothetical protein